jgi:hypothetical protein
MLDLKSEVLNKQKEISNKINIYNNVINENLRSIEDIFRYSKYEVNTIKEDDDSLTLELKLENNKRFSNFRYKDIINEKREVLYVTTNKEYIESELKRFIVGVAIEADVIIEEGIGDYKVGTKVELIKDLIANDTKEIVKKGLKGEVTYINYKLQEIRVVLEDASISETDEEGMKEKFKIIK